MISVIIPSYNHSTYITDAICSCLSTPLVQEVLVVDDGSTDRSTEILPKLADLVGSKLRILDNHSGENLGAHARLNQLTDAARTDWVAVLNSDDTFPSGRFSALPFRSRNHLTEMYFGDIRIIDHQGNHLGIKRASVDPQYPWPKSFDLTTMVRDQNWLPLLFHQNLVATTSNIVYTKRLHAKLGGFRAYRYVHDWDFVLRACAAGKLAYAPEMLVNYRIHSTNTIKESAESVDREIERMFNDFFADFPKLNFAKTSQDILFGSSREFATAIQENPILQPKKEGFAIIPPSSANEEHWAQVAAQLHSTVVVKNLDAAYSTANYLYAPSAVEAALSVDDLRSVMLALSLESYDFVLVSKSLGVFPELGIKRRRDAIVVKSSFARSALTSGRIDTPMRGWFARLMPGDLPTNCWKAVFADTKVRRDRGYLVLGDGEYQHQERKTSAWRFSAPKSAKPTVFILPGFIAIGGVERIMIEIMERLRSQYDFVVVCTEHLRPEQGSWHDRVSQLARIFDLPELLPHERFAEALDQLSSTYSPEVVWIINGSTWQVRNAGAMRQIFRKSAIVDHQVYDDSIGWIENFSDPDLRTSDRYVAINTRIENALTRKYAIDKTIVELIYHPFDSENFINNIELDEKRAIRTNLGLPDNKHIFGFVARITEQKDPLRLLELANACNRAGRDDCHFLMVGEGDLSGACAKTIERLNLTNVTRVGFTRDLKKIYSVLDGLIVTSKYEGLPIAMLEAMAMGVPILSTDVGDIGAILKTYRSGRCVSSDISVSELFQAFEEWRVDLPRLTKQAKRSAKLVRQRFSGESVAKQYAECFRRAIQSHSR